MRRTYLISCNARVKSWSLKVESKLEREGKLDGSRLQSFYYLGPGSRVRERILGRKGENRGSDFSVFAQPIFK